MTKRPTRALSRKKVLHAAIFSAALGLSPLTAWAFTPFTVSDIQIHGLEHTDPGTVFNYLPIKVGSTVNEDNVRAAIAALYATGLFENVQIGHEGGRLVVTVRERPTIAAITLTGVKAFPQDKLKESLKDIGLVERRVFDPATLDQVVTELQRQYYAMGYYAAKVNVKVDHLARNRVALRIDVHEGKPAKIRQINIVGNHVFPRKTLIGLFSLSKPNAFSLFTKDDQYSKQKLAGDLEKLRSYYLDRGYLEFNIDSTQVNVTPDRRNVFITVNIKEGPQYHIKSVMMSGNTGDVPRPELEKLIKVKAGQLFSRREVSESTNAMLDRLADNGYALANINPAPEIDKKKRQVAINFQVNPGRRVYVRHIVISGNNKTRDYVIRREFRQLESSLYSASKIKRSKVRLDRLGYFDSVQLSTTPVPNMPDQVDIDVKVAERSTNQFNLAVGYSNAQGALFSGSVVFNNFRGKGQSLSMGVDISQLSKSFNLSFTEPYFTPDGISLGYDVYRTDTNTQRLVIAPYRQVTTGGGVRLGLPLTEHANDSIRLGYDVTDITTMDTSPPLYVNFVNTFGNRTTSLRLSNTLSYDSRDSYYFPTRGWFNQLTTEAALPGGSLRYYRVELQGQRYQPLFGDFVGLLNADYGLVNGYSGRPVPFFQNFYLGGPNSVRGYRTYSLGPQDSTGTPLGGTRKVQANAELFFPVPGLEDQKSIRGSVFFDSGWVYDGRYLPQFGDLRKSVGLGFSWFSPLGPLRFSWAFPIGAKPQDSTEPFQFTIGTNF